MLKNSLLASMLILSTSVFATPKQLITHNHTNVESNAFINGTIASQHPTKPNSDNKVFWASVRLACYGHIANNKCEALIKMATDTPNPISLGTLSVDLITGEINPKSLAAEGYRLEVDGPGETSLYQD